MPSSVSQFHLMANLLKLWIISNVSVQVMDSLVSFSESVKKKCSQRLYFLRVESEKPALSVSSFLDVAYKSLDECLDLSLPCMVWSPDL